MLILRKRYIKKLKQKSVASLKEAEQAKRDGNDNMYWYWMGKAEALEQTAFSLEYWSY